MGFMGFYGWIFMGPCIISLKQLQYKLSCIRSKKFEDHKTIEAQKVWRPQDHRTIEAQKLQQANSILKTISDKKQKFKQICTVA